MAGYLALSNELRDLIEISPEDLSRLSRTSKSMRRALLPRLYKRVALRWEALKPVPPISSLLGAILRSPEIAAMVEELHFHAKRYGESIAVPERKKSNVYIVPDPTEYFREDKPRADSVEGDTKQLLLETLRSMQMPGIEGEETLHEHDLLDMVIGTIIARCPNLRVLRLDVDFLHQNTFLLKALRHLLNIESGSLPTAYRALMKLKSVQLDATNFYWACRTKIGIDFPLASYLPFFYLPSLEIFSAPFSDSKHVEFSGQRPPDPLKAWPTSPPPVFNLRRLNLCRTLADPATLTFLLAQMPHLESLNYELHRNADKLLDCVQLRRALISVARTLREFTFSVDYYITQCGECTEKSQYLVNGQGIGSLDFLSRLTKLEIALPFLLGWEDTAGLRLADALPAALKEFCLRDDCIDYMNNIWWEEVTIEEVRHWMEQKSKGHCTPNLKRFGFRMCESESMQWNKHHYQILMNICIAQGLQWWSERRPSRYDWELADDAERVRDKTMEFAGYIYPQGELGSLVKRAMQNSTTP